MRVLLIGGWGYLGSHLEGVLRAEGHSPFVVDCAWFSQGAGDGTSADYRSLTREFLDGFDAVVLTAAHSSVPMCQSDPYGAFRNNVGNFVELLSRLRRQKLIYASSSCVYVDTGATPADETTPTGQPCDTLTLTKTVIDLAVQQSDVEFYGLRLGSVNGHAPNLRSDLMINAMVGSALEKGAVMVSNAHLHRPILGIADFGRAVLAILEGPDRRGIYNVSSFNDTIGQIGSLVAERTGTKVHALPDSFTYDFSLATAKFAHAYTFTFAESVETIVDGLVAGKPRNAARRDRCPEVPYG